MIINYYAVKYKISNHKLIEKIYMDITIYIAEQ